MKKTNLSVFTLSVLSLSLSLFFFFSQFALADVNTDSNATSGLSGDTQTGVWSAVGEPFVADITGNITSVSICVYDNGGITNDVTVDIQADSSGQPSGVSLGSFTIPVGSITSTHQKVSSNNGSVAITSGLTYWEVVSSLNVNQESAECGDSPGSNTFERNLNIGGWSNAVGGTMSSTVFTSAGGGGGGSGTSTVQQFATTTQVVDNPTDDLYHGILLFWVPFAFVIWIFKRKTS